MKNPCLHSLAQGIADEQQITKILELLKSREFVPFSHEIVRHVQNSKISECIYSLHFLDTVVRYPKLLERVAEGLEARETFYEIAPQR